MSLETGRARFDGALREINGLAASFAGMGPIKLVREDLHFFAAIRAFADEGGQILVSLETRTVHWCVHWPTPIWFRALSCIM